MVLINQYVNIGSENRMHVEIQVAYVYFFETYIAKGVSTVNWENFEDGIVLKVDKFFFGLVQAIYHVCA